MATLADIRTELARELRDPSNTTFTTTELDNLINMGIDALADFYPREIVQNVATAVAGTASYALGDFENIYRLDIYSSAGSYKYTYPQATGDGPNTGWESHGGYIWISPWLPIAGGDVLKAFGYGRYVQLAASTSTTDMSRSGINAVLIFAMAEAYTRLANDRAKFVQYQTQEGNSDASLVQMNNNALSMRGRWHEERQRLRRPRKLG